MKTDNRKYLSPLNALRFFAALIVVIFHYGKNSFPFDNGFLADILNSGSIAVSFFFFLSGVVLCYNHLDDGISFVDFIKKRIKRIYPVYIICFLLSLVLAMIFYNSYPKGFSVILQLFAIHAWYPGISLEINYPAWSISVEMFFYLVFPFFIKFFQKYSAKKITFFVVLIWLLSSIQHLYFEQVLYELPIYGIGHFILYFPLWHLNTFLFGMLCGKYILMAQKSSFYIGYRIMYLSSFVFILLILGTDNMVRAHTHNGLLSPLFFLLVAGLSLDKSIITRVLSFNFFHVLGNASYSLYLLQYSVFILISYFLQTEVFSTNQFYWYLLILVGISALFYKFVDNKIAQKLRNWK